MTNDEWSGGAWRQAVAAPWLDWVGLQHLRFTIYDLRAGRAMAATEDDDVEVIRLDLV